MMSQAGQTLDTGILEALRAAGLEVITSEHGRASVRRDASLYQGTPLALVRFAEPASLLTESRPELALKRLFAIAREHHLPLTFVGSRTSVAGQAVNHGGLVVDMARFAGVGALAAAAEPFVETEPGVILERLNATLRRRAMPGEIATAFEHTLDLSSRHMATIGGTIMNNGGGILATKYGSARDNVYDLEIALPDGRITWTSQIQERGQCADIYGELRRALLETGPDAILAAMPHVRKVASGYNLQALAEQARDGQPLDVTQLFVGSEGTLGTLLRARVRVRPVAHARETVLIFFDDLEAMARAVQAILRIELDGRVILPRALEVISGSVLAIFEALGRQLPLECRPPDEAREAVLLVEYDDPPAIASAAIARLRQVCAPLIPPLLDAARGCFRVITGKGPRRDAWELRRDVVQRLNEYGAGRDLLAPPFIEDIGVPVARLGMLIHFLQSKMHEHELPTAIFGHAGDGNLHVRPLFRPDREHLELACHLMDDVYRQVVEWKGTISAEHGDGRLRTPYLELQYGTAMTALFKRIKELFDPGYILNPGVKVPRPDQPHSPCEDWEIEGFLPAGGGRPREPGRLDVV